MKIIETIILGLIQGLTEFIPVSSSGHLVLLQKIMGISNEGLTFEILLHMGTLVAVFVVFWKDIIDILKKPFQKKTYLILISTLVTFIIYYIFKDFFTSLYEKGNMLGYAFILNAIILYFSEISLFKGNKKNYNEIGYKDSIIVGLFQGFAIVPGISRSGATISGSLIRKIDKKSALRYSFLLSIPAILGGAFLDFVDIVKNDVVIDITPVNAIVGFVMAAVSGYFAIKFLIHIITKKGIRVFSYYVFVLGILILADQYIFNVFF